MPTSTYELWDNKVLALPFGHTRAGMTITKSITWGSDTTISSAKLYFSVKPSMDGVIAYFEHNEYEVVRREWWTGDSAEKSGLVDVIGSLVNGKNVFKFVGAKLLPNLFGTTFKVTARVVIEYEGEPPVVKPDWQKYLEYLAYGSAAAAGIVVVGRALTEEKK